MKTFLHILTIIFIYSSSGTTQEKMEIDGAIIIQNSEDPTPVAGTIRWTGIDFEGWNGSHWLSLTGRKQYGHVTDIEGHIYLTIIIGTQEWMAENLRTRRYRNNELITLTQSNATWSTTLAGAYTWYDNNSDYEIPYGKLYNWYAVDDPRGLCPTGWHVPSDDEWRILTNYLGGASIAGGKMKQVGSGYWADPNDFATNESGFTGLPGGYRNSSGSFFDLGDHCDLWSSTENGPNEAIERFLNYDDSNVDRAHFIKKRFGLSVRCVRD